MGNRIYLKSLNKDIIESRDNLDLKGKTLYELDISDLIYYNEDELKKIKQEMNFCFDELFIDGDGYGYYKINEKTLLFIIELYRTKLVECYKKESELLKDLCLNINNKESDQFVDGLDKLEYIRHRVNSKLNSFSNSNSLLNLNKESYSLTSSYFLEHSIFTLVHIYKVFDEKNNNLYLYLS